METHRARGENVNELEDAMIRLRLGLRRLVGVLSQLVNIPRLSGCLCCGRTWHVAKCHPTVYYAGGGCFPLCEDCWSDLTVAEREPYYLQLYEMWLRQGRERSEEEWQAIHQAVMDGK